MSSSLNRIKKNVIEAMQSANNQSTSAYDSVAEVRRVDGDTAWVHIAGGVDETPVKLTIAAKAGDVVQVRVGGGRAWITGNASAPPTDDKTAIAAKSLADIAGNRANTAKATADIAQSTATAAQSAADSAARAASTAQSKADEASAAASTAQSSADTAAQAAATAQSTAGAAKASASSAASAAATADSKATAASSAASRAESSASAASTAASQAVTDAAAAQTAANNAGQAASRAQAAADAAQGEIDDQQEYFWHDALGAHVLSDTDEVTGNRYRTDLKGAGQEIFELDGQTETSVASFGANGARLGETGGAHSIIDEDGQRFYASDGTTQLANIGYSEGQAQSGTAEAPYYTFGVRKSGSAVGNYSVAEGTYVISSGYTSHAEGQNTKASAYCAHAEGDGTTASGESAHAEGGGTTASGIRAHAEGEDALASEYGAHAEGGSTRATGYCAHAEGETTVAGGDSSHAEGKGTVANGYASHAQNMSTIAGFEHQTVLGKYNANSEGNAVEVGNGGGENSRSNAVTIDWNGDVTVSGAVTATAFHGKADSATNTNGGYVNATSGTFSGNVSGKSLSSSGNVTAQSMELSFSMPFIDFHYGNGSSDYDTRIINDASGRLSVMGNLNVTGAILGSGGVYDASGNLRTAINDKAAASHTHTASDITDLAKRFQAGSVKLTPPNASTWSGWTHVDFAHDFPGSPNLTLQPITGAPDKCFIGVQKLDASGFDVRIKRTDSTTVTSVHWMACEKTQ